MSWTKKSLLPIAIGLTLVQPVAMAAPSAGSIQACPATFAGARLSGGYIYDGPQEEHAILMEAGEVSSRSSKIYYWDVAYVYKAGRKIGIECNYKSEAKKFIEISTPASKCFMQKKHKSTRIYCK